MLGKKGFEKGYIPWNKGKPLSVETKKKMKDTLNGKTNGYKKSAEYRAKYNDYIKRFYRRLRYEVLSHYSGEQPRCKRCGFSDIRALCLDHINGDGAKQRRELSSNGSKNANSMTVYSWVKRNHYPADYQVLCQNCNVIKRIENKEFYRRDA